MTSKQFTNPEKLFIRPANQVDLNYAADTSFSKAGCSGCIIQIAMLGAILAIGTAINHQLEKISRQFDAEHGRKEPGKTNQ